MRLAAHLWSDLTGTPWVPHGRSSTGMDCYGVCKEVFRRVGVELPSNPDETVGWRRVPRAEIGALVAMTYKGRQHCGIVLGEDGLLHATKEAGVCVTSLAAVDSAIDGYFWPDGCAVAVEPTEGSIVWFNVITGERRIEPKPVGWTPPDDGYSRVVYSSESTTIVAVGPGEPATMWALATSLLLAIGSYIVQKIFAPNLNVAAEREEISSPAYDLSGFLSNTSGVGVPQPVCYGETRTGGHILSAFQRSDAQGRSVLYLLIMVSRGPIQSIGGLTTDQDYLTGSAIPSTITIDGNPASTYNCKVSTRLGTSGQTAMLGFRETVSATAYAITLNVGVPFVHVGTVRAVSLEAVIQFPLGLYNLNTSNGNLGSRTVTITMSYRLAGTSTWTNTTFVVSNARRGSFSRTWRVDNITRGVYEIQVSRVSPVWPETAQDHESRSDLIEVHEISADQLSYPGKALIGLQAIATDQLSGGVPQVNCILEGRKVYVWDGVSTTTPLFGSGEVFTDNPAWCCLDMLINPHYGMKRGGKITLDNIDLTSFQTWATLCDTTPDLNGAASALKRATVQLTVDATNSAWEFINNFAASHWGRFVVIGRKITVITEKVKTPVYQFSMANVREVEIGYTGRSQRPNVAEVQYFNAETNYEADQASRFDTTAVFTNGEAVVKDSIQAIGVTRASQAYRLAQYRLNWSLYSKRRVAFTAGPESIHLVPGDVIYFSHDAASIGTSGRIVTAPTTTTFTLDVDLTVAAGTNKILVKSATTDVMQERTLTNGTYARGATVSVTSAFSPAIAVGDVFAAGASTTYRKTLLINAIELNDDLSRRLSCVEYSDSIYSDDPGEIEEFTDTMPDPRAVAAAVSNLSAREIQVEGPDGTRSGSVLVEWDTAETWQSVDVWYRETFDGDTSTDRTWVHAGRHGYGRCQIDGLAGGATLTISAVPVAARGTHQTPDQGTQVAVYIRGRRVPPTSPTSVVAHTVDGVLNVCITSGSKWHQVRYGGTWGGSILIGTFMPGTFSMPCPFTGTQTVRVRTQSIDGAVSVSEVTDVVAFSIPASTYTLSSETNEHAAWAGTKTNTAVDGSVLKLSGSNLTGTYASATFGSATDFRGTTTLAAKLTDTALTWDDCGFRWNDPRWLGETWATAYLKGFEVSENLNWSEAGFTWASLPATVMTWGGPIDTIAALTPTIAVADGSDTWDQCAWERTLAGAATATVTMRRPHANYVPELTTMTDTLYTVTVAGASDHGALTGLADNDHPQYFLLAGAASDVEFAQMEALQFVVENRTSDPGSPVTGQMWLRTDL